MTVKLGSIPGTFRCNGGAEDILGHWGGLVSGESFPSLKVLRTPAGQPTSPVLVNFEDTNYGSGILSWSEPLNLGSPSLYTYVYQYSVDGNSWLDLPGDSTSKKSITISGLKANSDYWFRVRGENGGTVGQDTTFMNLNWAVIKVTMPAARCPAKPSDFASSSVTSSTFGLGWQVSLDNGGSPVTDFFVELSRNNGQSWQSVKSGVSTSTSLTVSGAAPGTTYLVRVAAVNAVGQSEWLMGSVTTLTTTASAPKSMISSNLAGTSLSLGWGLPDSNGGAGITDYQVEVTSNGSNSWTVIPHSAFNSLGFSVTNLLPGRTYQFRVSAVTSAGIGAASNIVTVTTLGAVGPNAPASLVISGVKTNAASLSWPGVVATQKVSNYLVDVSTDGSTWIAVSKRVSTSTSLALSGLKLGTSYQVRVAAVNSVGTGAYVYGSFTTLATVSTAPTALVSSSLSSSGFTLNWTAPLSNGGAAITDYVVEINGGGFSWSPLSHDITGNTSIAVTGLNPGIKYSVRVKAVNGAGISKTSTTLYVTTLATAPGTVTGLTVKSVTATSAAITWTAPNTGGAKISDYLAEYSTDNGQTWKTVVKSASSSTNLTLKGLKTKTSYLIRITAKNIVGYGAVGQSLTVTTS
jgi:titin